MIQRSFRAKLLLDTAWDVTSSNSMASEIQQFHLSSISLLSSANFAYPASRRGFSFSHFHRTAWHDTATKIPAAVNLFPLSLL